MIRASSWIAVAALCAACHADTQPVIELPSITTSSPAPTSCKPEAPIVLAIASRPLAADRYELTITVRPTKPLTSIDLALLFPANATLDRPARQAFGATAANATRTFVAVVTTTARATDVSAVVRVPVDTGSEQIAMSRAATITLGTPRPPPRTRSYALPDGDLAREVRP